MKKIFPKGARFFSGGSGHPLPSFVPPLEVARFDFLRWCNAIENFQHFLKNQTRISCHSSSPRGLRWLVFFRFFQVVRMPLTISLLVFEFCTWLIFWKILMKPWKFEFPRWVEWENFENFTCEWVKRFIWNWKYRIECSWFSGAEF